MVTKFVFNLTVLFQRSETLLDAERTDQSVFSSSSSIGRDDTNDGMGTYYRYTNGFTQKELKESLNGELSMFC